MKELNLPHKDPIKFAKYVVSSEGDTNRVRIKFDTIPSLAMLVEASAQSSASFGEGNTKMGYLVTLKNIKLLATPQSLEYDVEVTSGHSVDALTYFSFEVLDVKTPIASGIFIIALQ